MKDNEKLMSCFGTVSVFLLIVAVGTVMSGWALSTIWNWFIPPIFGLATLTLWQAVGVSMVFSLFTGTNKITGGDDKNKDTLERIIEASLQAVFLPLFYVATAWIVMSLTF